jgi:hypothetical protein
MTGFFFLQPVNCFLGYFFCFMKDCWNYFNSEGWGVHWHCVMILKLLMFFISAFLFFIFRYKVGFLTVAFGNEGEY